MGTKFLHNHDVFDCVNYSSLYLRGVNPNRLARWAAAQTGLPMVGYSDAHELPYPDNTFAWIEADR